MLFLAWTAESTTDTVVYCGHWRSIFAVFGPLFESIPGISLFPWQLALLALTPLCLLWPGAFHKRAWTMDGAILASLVSIALAFLWGMMRGGSAYNAYYQLWRFLVALLFGVLLASVIRKPGHLKALGFTVLAAALVRAGLAIYFYWALVYGKIDPPPPYMTTHDDSVLFVAGPLIMVSWAITRRRWGVWIATALLSLPLLYAIVLNARRLAWLELVLAFGCAYLLLPRGRDRRRVNRFLMMAAPVFLVYAAVGWGRPEPMFEPLRAFATSGSNEDASSLARLEEIRNLMYTLSLAKNPLLGTGWGIPYQQVTGFYTYFGDGWWQYPYMPHNSLLGVMAFSGFAGAFGTWLVVPVAAFLATRGYRGAKGTIERAATMSAVCILPAYGVQCYGDIGFQSFTAGLLLSVVMGVAAKASAWAEVAPRVTRGAAVPPVPGPSAPPRDVSWPPPGVEAIPSVLKDRRR
jgi:O-Antigen ligase